jgi:hypothetical protein
VTQAGRRLRGRIQLGLVGLRSRWTYALGGVGLAYGITSLVLEPPGGAVAAGIGFLFAAAGVVTFVADMLGIRREADGLHAVQLDEERILSLAWTDTYRGFVDFEAHDLHAMYDPRVNDALSTADVPVEYDPKPFRMPEAVRTPAVRMFLLRTQFRRKVVLFDDPKVRLASDITAASLQERRPVRLQRTSYFASLCTNEIARFDVLESTRDVPVLHGLDLASSNGYLSDLSASGCSNHIGIGTLAFTRDGHLVITVQAASSAQSPSLLAPSGAGSADVRDVRSGDTLAGFLARSMERELVEECGIRLRDLPEPMKTVPIGYARFLMRGGKPEFFGLTYIPVDSPALDIPRREKPFIADIRPERVNRDRLDELVETLKAYRHEKQDRLSLPLALHLEFLIGFVDRHPAMFVELIGGDGKA